MSAPSCPAPPYGVRSRTALGFLPWVASTADAVLRDHAHLLRQRRAPSRTRLHDDRGRRAGAAHAPAGRGRVLPHGYRRARRAGRAGGGEAGHHAARARRQERRALQGSRRHAQREQRLLHPHHRSGAHGQGGRGGAAHPRQRACVRRPLRGLVLPALRRLQDRVRARGRQPLPHPQDRARDRAGGQLVLPAVRVPGAARAPLRRAADVRHAAATATTKRCRSSRAACATSRSAARD